MSRHTIENGISKNFKEHILSYHVDCREKSCFAKNAFEV